MTAAVELPRCDRCKYALVNGVCPMCDGKQVAARIPMLAPIPAVRETPVTPFRRRRTRRSA